MTPEERSEFSRQAAAVRWGTAPPKLTQKQADEIRRRVAAGEPRKKMCEEYGVGKWLVGCIIRGTKYPTK